MPNMTDMKREALLIALGLIQVKLCYGFVRGSLSIHVLGLSMA